MKNPIKLLIVVLLIFTSCKVQKLKTFDYKEPVDTTTKKIQYQEKKTYQYEDVYADNLFDGARLNNFEKINDSVFRATILPENEPINSSPHYAFNIWSDNLKNIALQLYYPTAKHRYWPKYSVDDKNWTRLDSSKVNLADSIVELKIQLNSKKLKIAAQEIKSSTYVKSWAKKQTNHIDVKYKTIGKSKLNRDLMMLEIGSGSPKDKDLILLFSRQHPPEVSGYLAIEAFVEELQKDNRLTKDFREKYRILVFPLLNPDGVDLGHWRHNAGGVDLNRDWAYYRQPETITIANYIIDYINNNKNNVILGVDFHSTYRDLYYTLKDDFKSKIYPFKDYWMSGIDNSLPGYSHNS
ncbi:MAG: M14 family metallopeptidase [Bacteroidota bacterium]